MFLLKHKIVLFYLHLFVFICFITRCHSLSLIVIFCNSFSFVFTRCHALLLDVPLVVTRCHSLYHLLSFVVIHCHLFYHSLSLVVTRLSFYFQKAHFKKRDFIYFVYFALFHSRQNSDNKSSFSRDSVSFVYFDVIIRQQLKKSSSQLNFFFRRTNEVKTYGRAQEIKLSMLRDLILQ